MALKPKLASKQSQRQIFSLTVQRSLEILSMPTQQLDAFLAAELEENPVFEVIQSKEDSHQTASGPFYGSNTAETLQATESLIGSILNQLRYSKAPDDQISAASLFAAHLDERGFLDRSVTELASQHKINVDAMEKGLELLQSLEPAGIGARNVVECISLQLKSEGLLSPIHTALLQHPESALKDLSKISFALNVPENTVLSAMEDIRNQNPDFSDQFTDSARDYITPDIIFNIGADTEITVSLSQLAFPKLQMRKLDLQKTTGNSARAAKFLSAAQKRLTWLTATLEKRESTIQRIALFLAQRQAGYFYKGPLALAPLTMKQAAESLELNESTISRAVSGKFANSPQGTIPLKYLFSRGVMQDGSESLSSTMIRFRIGQIIANENPSMILTDTIIGEKLASEGITVARRTIAKYREGMNIPKSSIRRVQKRSTLRFRK